MNDVLLTVSGEIDPEIHGKIARRERPEADFIAMARQFNADLVDYRAARQKTGWSGRLLEAVFGSNFILAWSCFKERKNYRVILTDGEQVGLPLAFFLKYLAPRSKVRHLMFVHILSVWKKAILLDLFRLWTHIDLFFVYATWQKSYIQERWAQAAQKVVFTPFMVDANFFSPDQVVGDLPVELASLKKPVICSVGLEFRDYPTLIEAVRDLDVTLVIAAASPWSKRGDTTRGHDIPGNVIVRRFSQYDLRGLYALSEFVVMPLYDVHFQAGVTAILEALAMAKPVICSRTLGQTDVLVQGETGIYVPPEDPAALRTAIVYLLAHPKEALDMGRKCRDQVNDAFSLERYTTRLNQYIRQ